MGSRVFTAQYRGTCPACGERISPGEDVHYNDDDQLVHWMCSDSDEGGEPCPRCYLVHSGECF